jgi:hypothetical protein
LHQVSNSPFFHSLLQSLHLPKFAWGYSYWGLKGERKYQVVGGFLSHQSVDRPKSRFLVKLSSLRRLFQFLVQSLKITWPIKSALIGGKFILKKSFTRLALQSECCNFNQWEAWIYNRSCDF